jgi:hypothetical protein
MPIHTAYLQVAAFGKLQMQITTTFYGQFGTVAIKQSDIAFERKHRETRYM